MELSEEKQPWQVLRLLVPMSQEVARWWNATDDLTIRAAACEVPGVNDSRVECLHLEAWKRTLGSDLAWISKR